MRSIKLLISIFLLLQLVVESESQIYPIISTSKSYYNQYVPRSYMVQASNNSQCKGLSCLGEGESCTSDLVEYTLNPCTGSAGEKCCQYGLECFLGKCKTLLVYTGNVNDRCFRDISCNLENPNVKCVDERCKGLEIGERCNFSSIVGPLNPCVYGSYCVLGKCTQTINDGEACQIFDCKNGDYTNSFWYKCDQCNYGSFCDTSSTDPVCAKKYSKKLGEKCFSYDYPCDAGLVCVDGVCSNPHIYSSCNSNQDCWNGTTCKCNVDNGESHCTYDAMHTPSSQCVPYIQKYQECAMKFQCQDPAQIFSDFSSPLTCVGINCKDELSNLRACTCLNSLKENYGTCLYTNKDKLCKIKHKLKGWEIALIVIGVVIVVGLISGIAIYFGKKFVKKYKQQKDENDHNILLR